MSRFPQMVGQKGSLKWMQHLVNLHPEIINTQIRRNFHLPFGEEIIWLSPRAEDDYAEYRDQAFVNLLDIELSSVPLNKFWPARGPQWDALAKSNKGNIFLVEAKAHTSELHSPGTKAKGKSRQQIQSSLEKTKEFLNVNPAANWMNSFYQYTNRLAHLYLLRVLNNLPAHLVFIYFINDVTMNGPKNEGEWQKALKLLHMHLNIGSHKLSKYVFEVFIDVSVFSQ